MCQERMRTIGLRTGCESGCPAPGSQRQFRAHGFRICRKSCELVVVIEVMVLEFLLKRLVCRGWDYETSVCVPSLS